MTSAWRGSLYFPAGLLLSFESSHMQLSGIRVRKPEVGSAIKHRPAGFRTRNISLKTASRFATIRKRRETTIASMELEGSESACTSPWEKVQLARLRLAARDFALAIRRRERSTPVVWMCGYSCESRQA